MARNIYTQPIQTTGEVVETAEYTQDIEVTNGENIHEVVNFPQCLETFTEDRRKEIITDIMLKSLTENN